MAIDADVMAGMSMTEMTNEEERGRPRRLPDEPPATFGVRARIDPCLDKPTEETLEATFARLRDKIDASKTLGDLDSIEAEIESALPIADNDRQVRAAVNMALSGRLAARVDALLVGREKGRIEEREFWDEAQLALAVALTTAAVRAGSNIATVAAMASDTADALLAERRRRAARASSAT